MIKIAVRLDDITPDMDWAGFLKMKALLDRFRIKPLIGVVPDNRDELLRGKSEASYEAERKIRLMQAAEDGCTEGVSGDGSSDGGQEILWRYIGNLRKDGWTVAMHGYRHLYTTKKGGCFPLNHFSEFAGLPPERQEEMLLEGKRLLAKHGIETRIFMAPAHSYDRNTLRALKKAGFTAVTDGFGSRPYRWKGLVFYPISFQLRHTLRRKDGFSTLVIHPATVTADALARYEAYFSSPEVEWISWETYLNQQPVRAGLFSRGREYCMAAGKCLAASLLRKH